MDTGLERRGGPPSPGSSAHGPAEEREERRDRPRILFVSKTAEATGPTTSLTLLLDRLAHKYDVGVLVQGEGPFCDALQERGVPHWSFPTLQRRQLPEMVRFFRRQQFSLIYANETSRASRNVCVVGTLLGVPFVSHVRSMGWEHGPLRLGHLRLAKAVVTVSHACGDSVLRYVRSDRLHVVHNGVPSNAFLGRSPHLQAQRKRELGLSPDTPLILNVSHVTPRKGQALAADAMARVLTVHERAHLAVVGALDRDPSYVTRLEERVARPDLSGRVTILGFRTDVPRLLQGADVLLHTALADPHPRAVLEGMAAGVPVVAFGTDGVEETVVHGTTGFLTRPGDVDGLVDALVRVLSLGGAARLAMGQAGREHALENFGEDRTASRITGLLEGVLGEPGSRRA